MAETQGGDVLVSFRGVQKSYDGETLIVKDLNLDIRKGEFLTLLGPSGSGKTTSLMMLAGFETPTAGEILLAGRSINNVPPHKRDIGMVFQNYALFPHMSVAQNIAFPLKIAGVAKSEIDAGVEQALKDVRLADKGGRMPTQLSGGQRQRVAIARALVLKPALILLDEPTSALDRSVQCQGVELLRRLQRRNGLSYLFISHDLAVVKALSHQLMVVRHGKVVEQGSAEAVFASPQHPYTQQLLEAAFMAPASAEN